MFFFSFCKKKKRNLCLWFKSERTKKKKNFGDSVVWFILWRNWFIFVETEKMKVQVPSPNPMPSVQNIRMVDTLRNRQNAEVQTKMKEVRIWMHEWMLFFLNTRNHQPYIHQKSINPIISLSVQENLTLSFRIDVDFKRCVKPMNFNWPNDDKFNHFCCWFFLPLCTHGVIMLLFFFFVYRSLVLCAHFPAYYFRPTDWKNVKHNRTTGCG